MPGPPYRLYSQSTTGSVRRSWRSILLLTMAAFLLGGCARDYVSGRPTLSLIDEEQEIALGKEYDEQIVAQYGLYEDPDLAAFVDEIGQSLAAVSQRSNLEYHFRVLDDGVVNAFALPGGYIYMPRGILAFFNSEDQLAGVLGHETGHVVARHGVEQMSKQTLFTGFGLTDRLAQRFPVVGGIATAPINLGFLKYSRDQESESDRLGVEYTTRVGFDAHAMADFFSTLGAMSTQAGNSAPTYLSTHPHPEQRYEKVNQLADEWQLKVDFAPRTVEAAAYLKRIDGIVYGPDPRRGFTQEDVFYHPTLRFQFPVPKDWKLANSANRVLVVAPDEKALVQMTLSGESSGSAAADAFLASEAFELVERKSFKINGLPAVAIEANHVEGRQRTRVRARFIEHDKVVLVFIGLVAETDLSTHGSGISTPLDGVAPIVDRKILEVQPLRVHVVSAPVTGDLESALGKLGVPEEARQETAFMNGLDLEDQVARGDLLKVVR
jgi:predicted Zn-dependent protease